METAEVIKSVAKVSDFNTAYDFEVYDIEGTIDAFVKYRPLMFATIGIYLFLVYFGQKWMESRPAFKLTTPLFFWNMGLGIFSIVATIRGFPELFYVLRQPEGLYLSTCSTLPNNYATSFWALMFALSKFVELGDTAFIVLRKQKLIVLHWFHHVATLLMCWYGFEFYDTFGRYFIINTFVHSIMYPYYALKAVKVKIPKRASKAITRIQILQMFAGLYVNFYGFYYLASGRPCQRDMRQVYLSGVVIFIFVVLFINFYKQSYSRQNQKKVKSP
ncbi:unnamed protein product [Allacma fusca]|uniref:Elongation of very long chain fatty acids protein n=1 Tax=Allacma fusca TaxID=39272 RepID=A0A8J2NI97_9HEXA|nr:unnamed protein product [Allacma fusca]